jgi:hypothetical protein
MSLVDCAICGLQLGSGAPGAKQYCVRCAKDVIAKEHDNSGAIVAGVALLALGLFFGSLFFGGRK